jgi:copper chaperone CopZ
MRLNPEEITADMQMIKKYGLATLALMLGAAILAGCPSGKDAARGTDAAGQASNGAKPGDKIEATTPPAQQAPVVPPVAAPPEGLAISEFNVTGMQNSDSSAAVEGALIKLPGVTTVSADFKAGTAKVQYDPVKSKPADILKAIESLGFKATERQTGINLPHSAAKPQPSKGDASPDKGATPGAGA